MSSPFADQDDTLVNEINMTPFIDVMLVLLIVFMITLPVVNHAVKVDLPRASVEKITKEPQAIDIAIGAYGALHWDKEAVSEAQLFSHLDQLAAQPDVPPIRLFADRAVPYGRVAWVMANAQKRGLAKLDFVLQAETP
ncbi:ExbD/TolR family protein [Klebsiella variicola]|uniref:ExbD/TolR family protein n=1 Tax=Klebsiella variicola TaxID=244366 RepID=UPI003D31F690